MKKINTVIIKKYLLLIVSALLFFLVFIFLEKNNHTYFFLVNTDNEINSQSIDVLNQVTDEKSIIFEVYTQPESAVAKKIKHFFMPYLRLNKNLQLNFLDPVTHPNEVKLNAVTMQGEMVLRFKDLENGSKVNITELSESAIINAILILLNQKNEWLVVAEGYGMSNIADESEMGLSNFLIHLKKIGFHIARMPLNTANVLPDNVKAIILPAPTEVLNIEIVEWLKAQTNKGISLWWLNDVGIKNQNNLELVFDVMNSGKINLENDQYTAYVSAYANHPITENFNQPIYIAQAREIIADGFLPLFVNTENTTFAVTKQLNKSRLVITGDADLIRNQYLNTAANKSMTVRIVDWLLYHDDRVNVPVKISKNTQLLLTQNQLLGFSLFFLIILPFIFVVIAFKQWRKKHGK